MEYLYNILPTLPAILLEARTTFRYHFVKLLASEMADDFIYTVNQAALIVNRSDKVIRGYITDAVLDAVKKIEEGSGIEKVFISAGSLAALAERKKLSLNFFALKEYTPDPSLLERAFAYKKSDDEKRAGEKRIEEKVPSSSSEPSSASPDESLVVSILKEQLEKVEKEKEELKRDLREKDRQMEEKNRELLEATRESGQQYQLIALAKEQAEAQLTKLQERTRILHLSTNRDIERLREGKLQASDISLLPVASDTREGEFESEPPRPPYEPPSPPVRETVIDVAPGVDEPVDVAPPQGEDAGTASSPPEEEEGIAPTISEPENIERPKSRKQEKPAAKKKSEKKEPEKPVKRGFFRRLFG